MVRRPAGISEIFRRIRQDDPVVFHDFMFYKLGVGLENFLMVSGFMAESV
jgi:hypothetical protein